MAVHSFVCASALALLATLVAGISPSDIRSRAVSDFWSIVRHPFQSRPSPSFLRSLDYKLKLRVCNAYASEAPFDVYLNQAKIEEDLEYTDCFQYMGDLRSGDRLNFKIKTMATGSFTIDALPRQDATLLLVISRHGDDSLAAKFFSHVFGDLKEPHVAVLDTYQGPADSKIQLEAEGSERKDLSAGQVRAIDEGSYKLILRQAGQKQQNYDFIAEGKEAYAVIRCGMKSYVGKSYPEELVIFPRTVLPDENVKAKKAKPSNEKGHEGTGGEDGESEKGGSEDAESKKGGGEDGESESEKSGASAVALPSLLLLLGAFWVLC